MKSIQKGNSTKFLNLYAIIVLFLATTSWTRAADNEVITKMTVAKIEKIMKSFTDVKNFKELENNLYVFEILGMKVVLHNGLESLQLLSIHSERVTISRLNEWNRERKFTKAYLDANENPCLDHAIELTGGVTEKNVKEWVSTYVAHLKEFKKHLAE